MTTTLIEHMGELIAMNQGVEVVVFMVELITIIQSDKVLELLFMVKTCVQRFKSCEHDQK